MNYLLLKTIIESTLANFKCKECSSGVSEGNLNILGIAGNSINMEVVCPNCRTTGVVKAEIGFMNNKQNQNNINQFFGPQIKSSENVDQEALNDSDILSIREDLKNCNSIEDLFN